MSGIVENKEKNEVLPAKDIENNGVYVGEWDKLIGTREGKGILFLENNVVFQGKFRNSKANGSGRMLYPMKNVRFYF